MSGIPEQQARVRRRRLPARFGGAITAITGFLSRASSQIVTFALTLVATRYLAPAEFGVFSLAAIATTLIRTMLYAGAFEHLLKAPDARDSATESLVVNLLLGVGLSALVGLVASIAWAAGASGELVRLLLILLPSNLIAAVAAWRESLLLRTTRIRLYYGATLSAELISMLLAVGLFVAGWKLDALVAQVYCRNVTILFFYTMIGGAMFSRKFSRETLMGVLRWSTSRYGAVLLTFGSTYAADLFLGIFLSPAATGLYRASSRLVVAIADVFNQPLRLIGMTLFSKRASKGQGSSDLWPLVFVAGAAVGWSALGGLAAGSGTLVPLVLGARWSGAAPLVAILCCARALMLLDSVTSPVLVAYNHQRSLFWVQCFSGAMLLVTLAIVARFGPVAATLATAGVAMLNSTILFTIASRRMPGAGQALRRQALLLAAPVTGTVAGALAAQIALAATAAPLVIRAVAVVGGGATGFALAMLLVHRRARQAIERLAAAGSAG